jgi:alcohol dehydrogenase (cytochrome c)
MRYLTLVAAITCLTGTTGAQVPYARLVQTDHDSASWLTYSGNYAAQRYSRLGQINARNVASLHVAWVYQATASGTIETTPVVADGVMYITEPPSTVVALDAHTGRELWRWTPAMRRDVGSIGGGPLNRGVALLDSSVYVATLDANLVALDARSGAVRWSTPVADNHTGYFMTAAPLAVDGKIIVGVSGGEAGIRGFVDAYDARTGRRLWRFHTVPAPGEPGSETWSDTASWRTGGGATWLTGSYDPQLKLIYWGVGNPGPDWNGDPRGGDNLYTCSLIALDAVTGALRWHFQFTPHDTHDWDATEIPVLFDGVVNGKARKLVAMANRNAFYYLLDRTTGEFLLAREYAHQTWAKGIDAKGRPVALEGKEPTVEGNLVFPSLQGSTNWFSPSYSPATNALYVAVREMGSYYYKTDAEYTPGTPFMGGGERALDGDSASGAIRAIDAITGARRWNFAIHSPPWTGVLSTAGGLVFAGSNEGNFFALDARTGRSLWDFQTGGPVRAGPMAFMLGGKQYIGIAARRNIYVFALP